VTPLETAPPGLAGGRRVFLKREDVHELGAFKWRGALPTLEQYQTRGARGVVTASTGNHGAATAWAARRTGLSAVVFAPQNASRTKLDVIASQGAEIRLVGRDLDEAKEEGRAFALARNWPFFEDGDEPAQYGGYGEIAIEILQQCPERPGAVVVPVGNGALAAGIGLVLKERSPGTALIAVAAAEAPVMAPEEAAGTTAARVEALAAGPGGSVPCPRPPPRQATSATRSGKTTRTERA